MLNALSSLSNIDTGNSRSDCLSAPWKKVVVVGDSKVGKTCLVTCLATDKFPGKDVPRIAKNYNLKVPHEQVIITLVDTGGLEKCNKTRPMVYPETDVIIMCFSVDSPSSLKNIEEKWIPEIKHFCSKAPILLVANKADVRKDTTTIQMLAEKNQEPVKSEDGRCMAERINAFAYLKCSAKSRKGLPRVFQNVIAAATGVR